MVITVSGLPEGHVESTVGSGAWVDRDLVDANPEEGAGLLLRDLRTSQHGLSNREAARRLAQFGRNELTRRGNRRWPLELARQLTHPLALLLWAAAALSALVGNYTIAVAVLLVIFLNALFAFVQELQAERAVEALARYLPQTARTLRDGAESTIDAAELVPGDIVQISEGDRVAADLRLLSGAVEVDLSTLTGESVPALRAADLVDQDVPLLAARDLVFSGTSCTGGEARGVVVATGMRTELGRIAALSERVKQDVSPLERQVRRVAWLIAAIAVAMTILFIPVAVIGAGLSIKNAVVFAVGLLAGNVPEGLLPVITLALAVAVRDLARQGAVVKRLSAAETLGSTNVICTDKTGTLTENRMSPVAAWTVNGIVELQDAAAEVDSTDSADAALGALARTAAACNNARLESDDHATGDPTEVALLLAARRLGCDVNLEDRQRCRSHDYHFDPQRKLMSTVDTCADGRWLHSKGAPESLLPRCSRVLSADGIESALVSAERDRIQAQVELFAEQGLRVLALARTRTRDAEPPKDRDEWERELCFVGLMTMLDPPRPQVAEAVARCRSAGIRVIVITGDHPLTATAIARQVGIVGDSPTVINAEDLAALPEHKLGDVLKTEPELVFARATPEAKLQIAEALRAQGNVVAMTGDGVNDAPALRTADIGIAMGRSGTDVAREAATMVLTDDNFATIVVAIEAGRRVYDNVRKFILYIFAHATPEVMPFLLFALAGGAIPLPLTVLQILAFDVGTETLPSLALARDPAEPGIMNRPPRQRSEGVIRGPMLIRAWLFLGGMITALSLGGFFYVLTSAGWSPGDATGPGHALHHAYLQATTMTFAGLIAGQIGSAFAVRTQRASLRSIGVFTNRYLLAAIAAELALAGCIVYAPPLQSLLGTAGLPLRDLALLLPYPFIVWGADELRRYVTRSRTTTPSAPRPTATPTLPTGSFTRGECDG